MLARHPDLGCSLSDHFSVEATLLLHTSTSPNLIPPHSPSRPPSPKKPPQQTQLLRPSSSSSDRSNSHDHAASLLALEHGTYLQSPTGSEYRVGSRLDLRASFDDQLRASPASPSSAARRGDGLPCTTYDEVLALIRTYSSRERAQRRWRMIHFAIWTFIVIACYVAVWFVGHVHPGVAFAFLVLSSVGFLAGAVDGLMGLLFFGGEIRTLAEFEWEIMNAKATASGAHGLAQQQLDDEDDNRGTSAGTGGNEKGW